MKIEIHRIVHCGLSEMWAHIDDLPVDSNEYENEGERVGSRIDIQNFSKKQLDALHSARNEFLYSPINKDHDTFFKVLNKIINYR